MTNDDIARVHAEFQRAETAFILRTPELGLEQSQHFELLLLLVGMKPSVLICPHYAMPWLTAEIVKLAWGPVAEAFPNLVLAEITHDLITCHGVQNWKSNWVLGNVEHPAYPVVKRTLLEPTEGEVSLSQTAVALGYPVHACDDFFALNGHVEYLNGGIVAFEYHVQIRKDACLYLAHFVKARRRCRDHSDLQFGLDGWRLPLPTIDALVNSSPPRASLGMAAVVCYIDNLDQNIHPLAPKQQFDIRGFIDLLVSERMPNDAVEYCLAMPPRRLCHVLSGLAPLEQQIEEADVHALMTEIDSAAPSWR